MNALLRAIAAGILVVGCAVDTTDADEDDVADNEEALSAEAAIGGHAFGLGVDAPVAVASPLYPTLVAKWTQGDAKLSTARTVFYLSDDGYHPDKLRTWVDAVKRGGLQPMVSLSVLRKQGDVHVEAVPRATYRARFDALLHAFPDVAFWGTVNEPDLEMFGDSATRAKDAAVYYADAYKVLRRCQNANRCKGNVLLVAGEFAFQGGNPDKSVKFWNTYASALSDQVKSKEHPNAPIHRFPRIWGMHPYIDTIVGRMPGTDRFDDFLGDVERNEKLPRLHLRAWLTETGGILHVGSGCATSGGDINGSAPRQAAGAKEVFAMQSKSRVDRVYWWQFQQVAGHPWDSAMVDATGTPRAAFCALTKQATAACAGDPFATQCKP